MFKRKESKQIKEISFPDRMEKAINIGKQKKSNNIDKINKEYKPFFQELVSAINKEKGREIRHYLDVHYNKILLTINDKKVFEIVFTDETMESVDLYSDIVPILVVSKDVEDVNLESVICSIFSSVEFADFLTYL